MFLPPVAEMTLVTAAGLRDPRADWSATATVNLSEALSAAISKASQDTAKDWAKDWAIVEGETAYALSHDLATIPESADFSLLPDRPDMIGLIIVKTDVESSASRLVQTGLDIIFGGVPGPDGIDQFAHLCLYDRASGVQLWCKEMPGEDARTPAQAANLITGLLAMLNPVKPD